MIAEAIERKLILAKQVTHFRNVVGPGYFHLRHHNHRPALCVMG